MHFFLSCVFVRQRTRWACLGPRARRHKQIANSRKRPGLALTLSRVTSASWVRTVQAGERRPPALHSKTAYCKGHGIAARKRRESGACGCTSEAMAEFQAATEGLRLENSSSPSRGPGTCWASGGRGAWQRNSLSGPSPWPMAGPGLQEQRRGPGPFAGLQFAPLTAPSGLLTQCLFAGGHRRHHPRGSPSRLGTKPEWERSVALARRCAGGMLRVPSQ